MNKIVKKEKLADRIYLFEVEAPLIAVSRKAGNFIIARVGKLGERMPFAVIDSNTEKGTIRFVVQETGASSRKLTALNEGEYITDIAGPLGKPTEIKNVGTVLAFVQGVGAAHMLPIVKASKEIGNKIVTIFIARSKERLILREELTKYSDELIIMTDDGSEGKVTAIAETIDQIVAREKIDFCFAVGPASRMKICAETTKKYDIPTMVSLNAIVVDGTGMCGACRVTVGGETKFACVDGPQFDGHKVDFDEFLMRLNRYKEQENVHLHSERNCKAETTV